MNAPAIIVCSLDQATAALTAAGECGREIILLSPPDAAASMGPLLFQSMIDLAHEKFPDAPFTAALGCGDNAGHALAAIRQGIKAVVLSDTCPARDREADIARQNGTRLMFANVYGGIYGGPHHPPALDLIDCPDPLAACRKFLHTEENTPMPESP